MFVLKHWVFLKQIEIVNQRRKMLDATESSAKGKDNFANKVISTENIEKKCKKM